MSEAVDQEVERVPRKAGDEVLPWASTSVGDEVLPWASTSVVGGGV